MEIHSLDSKEAPQPVSKGGFKAFVGHRDKNCSSVDLG